MDIVSREFGLVVLVVALVATATLSGAAVGLAQADEPATEVSEPNATTDRTVSVQDDLTSEAASVPDGQEPVEHNWREPYSAIGPVYSSGNDDAGGPTALGASGTGVLVSPYHVLTSAHNVADDDGTVEDKQFWFAPGATEQDGDLDAPFGRAAVEEVRILPEYDGEGDHADDLALLTLDRAIGSEAGTFDVEGHQVEFDTDPGRSPQVWTETFTFVGYPGSTTMLEGTAEDANMNLHGGLHVFYTEVEDGNSGGPMFIDPDDPAVHSVVAGDNENVVRDSSRATPITPEREALLEEWMDEDDWPTDRPEVYPAAQLSWEDGDDAVPDEISATEVGTFETTIANLGLESATANVAFYLYDSSELEDELPLEGEPDRPAVCRAEVTVEGDFGPTGGETAVASCERATLGGVEEADKYSVVPVVEAEGTEHDVADDRVYDSHYHRTVNVEPASDAPPSPVSMDAPGLVAAGEEYEVTFTVARSGDEVWSTPMEVDAEVGSCTDAPRATLQPRQTVTVRCTVPATTPAWVETETITVSAGGDELSAEVEIVEPPDPGEARWSFREPSSNGRSSPTVVDGTAYVGANEGALYALDAAAGDVEWRFGAPEDSIRSSPAVADGTAYVGSNDGTLYAVDAETGEEAWRFEDPTDQVESSPTVAAGTVYVGSRDGTLYAVDATTGEREWAFEEPSDAVLASPTVADGTVYVGSSDGTLYAVDATTGETEWTLDGLRTLWSSPTVADGTVYVGSFDESLYAVNATTGEEEWAFEEPSAPIRSSPTVAYGTVYVGSGDETLYAVDARTGEEEWAFDEPSDRVRSSPTVAYGTVYVGANDETLYAVDAWTGEEEWAFEEPTSYVYSSPTVADGRVYVGTLGELFAVATDHEGDGEGSRTRLGTLGHVGDRSTERDDSTGGTIQWEVDSSDRDFPPPTVANGTVYLAGKDTDDNVHAYDAETGELQWHHSTRSSIRDSPSVANGTVYVLDAFGTVFAIDAVTGQREWSLEVGVDGESSVVQDGTAYLVSQGEHVLALDLESREVQWRVGGDGYNVTSYGLSVVDDAVYFGSDAGVHAVDASSGAELWGVSTDGLVQATPTATEDGVFVGSRGGTFYGIDRQSGSVRWTDSDVSEWQQSPPTVANGTVYVGSNYNRGDVLAYDAETGTRRWRSTAPAHRTSFPVTVAGDAVIVPARDNTLHAVDAESGDQRWAASVGSPAYKTAATVWNGTAYYGGEDGTVTAVGLRGTATSDGSRVRHGTRGHVGDRATTEPEVSIVDGPGPIAPGEQFLVEVAVNSTAGDVPSVATSLVVDGTTVAERTVEAAEGATVELSGTAPPELPDDEVAVDVLVDGESSDVEATAPVVAGCAPVAEPSVCDVDGDDRYRDVTGDGSVTQSDVTEFFGNQHLPAWDEKVDWFDFNGDGDVGQADVVALFEYVVS